MIRDGHEVSAHGYWHEHPNELSDEQEEYWLKRSLSALQAVSGEKPAGWRAPLYNFSHPSAQLLLDAGISYDASLMGDDLPYLLETSPRQLLEFPPHWGMDRWPPLRPRIALNFHTPM